MKTKPLLAPPAGGAFSVTKKANVRLGVESAGLWAKKVLLSGTH